MRPDLQELEITLGELKRLTGLNWQRYQKSRGVYLLRPIRPLLFSQMNLLGNIGTFSGVGTLFILSYIVRYYIKDLRVYNSYNINGLFVLFVIFFAISIVCLWPIVRLGKKDNKANVFLRG